MKLSKISPVLFAFFVMGFVDVVGVSTSYVKKDFGLSDTLANLLPMMVFIWFAVFSLPTGWVMGKFGRKNMVLFSIVLTMVSMLLPFIDRTYTFVMAAFVLLGIANTILQVALNPLVLNVVPKKKVDSMLTLGYFIKAVSSTLGPIIVSLAVGMFGDWYMMFFVYAVTACLSFVWLVFSSIEEKQVLTAQQSFINVLSLLKRKRYFLSMSIIIMNVGFEIGLMTAVPQYLGEYCGLPIEKGSLGCSVYFMARTLGTLLGTFVLTRYPSHKFLIGNLVLGGLASVLFLSVTDVTFLMGLLFVLGLTCANIFPITLSQAIQSGPENANEVSALMVMGVAGGAVLPMVMGVVSDISTLKVSLLVPVSCLLYILIAFRKLSE